MVFMFKVYANLLPTNLLSFFKKVNNTRNNNNKFEIRFTRTTQKVGNICDPSGRNQSHVGRVCFPLRAKMHGRAHIITDSCFIAFITFKIC